MTPDVVVDIGNSRMKWGRCADGRVMEMVSLPLDDPTAWEAESGKLPPTPFARKWAVASVNPPVLHRFVGWANEHGRALPFEDFRGVPLRLAVERPEEVGVDRLMSALAAWTSSRPRPVVAISIGTAITIDLVDDSGAFLGGAILPGPQLMAKSLNQYTAKLPLIDASNLHTVQCPGTNTRHAIELGIGSAVGGAVSRLIEAYSQFLDSPPIVFFTGGDMGPFTDLEADEMWTPDPDDTRFVPTLTLEGIRIAAEALP